MTPLIHFHHAPNAALLAKELADFVAQRLRTGVSERGRALLVLSGGSTPVPFFEALAQCDLDWSRVTITLADERWVPEEHADSNARLVKAYLLQGRAAQANWVPLFNDEVTPQGGQAAIEQTLAGLCWPADVVVLGMGGDGHTASLFPYAPELPAALADMQGGASSGHEGGGGGRGGAEHVVGVAAQRSSEPGPRCMAVAAPASPNVPIPRLTLTARALLDTRCLVLHITGAAKWALLQSALQDGPLDQWPIRLALHQDRVPCEVFHAD